MKKQTFAMIENYMLSCMEDSAHDKDHIYRVLYHALNIAKEECDVDYDVLICACLLHDIGRKDQFENPSLCHATVGGDKAYVFLTAHGFDARFAEHVRQCIQTHRYRKNNLPQSIEAKILFDADKLDAAGAMGIARTLLYQGIVSDPIYAILPDGTVSDGSEDTTPSFFREYKYKLETLYDRFYTVRAAAIAQERQQSAIAFYHSLLHEVQSAYAAGKDALTKIITEDQK